MKNPPILIAVLGFFGLMTAFFYIFAGLRMIGFDWFGAFKDAPATQGYWFWGALWVIVGIVVRGGVAGAVGPAALGLAGRRGPVPSSGWSRRSS